MPSVYSLLVDAARSFPKNTALVFKDKKYTYSELLRQVDAVRLSFLRFTENQDIVSLYMDNSDEWLIVYFGIIGAGCVCNPIDTRIADKNILYQLGFSESKYLVTSVKLIEKCKRLGLNKQVKLITPSEILNIKNGCDARENADAEHVSIMYTSGTTANQKAIRLPHRVVHATTLNIIEYLKLKESDIYYAILPFSHSFGLGNVHTIFGVGGTVVISENTINLKNVLKEIKKYKATFFAAVPLTLKILTENFLSDFILVGQTVKIICTNTGPMPPDITTKILDNLKETNFFTYYGLTEASRSTFFHFNSNQKLLRSVGKPLPGVEVKIVTGSFRELSPGQVGEVCIKGVNTVSEYWKNKNATDNAFKNGWLLTGDAGFFDKNGFLFIVGRNDDVINIGGEKASLAEIDEILQSVKGVKDAAVVAMADAETEFAIKSYIVLKDGVDPDEARTRIIEACRTNLEHFKIPKVMEFVETIPRTNSGKLQRKKLK